MTSKTVYAIRWKNLWWSGKNFLLGKVDKCGSPNIEDANFLADENIASDVADEIGGQVKRVDLVTE